MSANAADRKSIRAAEKAARIAARQRYDVITQIMSTSYGRAWLWDHLSSARIFCTTHVAGDPNASAFQEGRRSLGLELFADILAACPDMYIQAMREANDRHNSDDRSPDDTSAADERRRGPILDGGDSGPSAGAEDGSEDGDAPEIRSPGADIYVQ